MPIADAFREAAEVVDFCELFGFKDQVIVAEALKLCESHIWSAAAERSGNGASVRTGSGSDRINHVRSS